MKIQNIDTVVIPLAFNHPLYDPCQGAYLRFLAGIREERRAHTVVIQTAGYSKEDPRTPSIEESVKVGPDDDGFSLYSPRNEESLSKAMKVKLEEELHPWAPNFIARPLTWGTEGEIKYGFRMIRQLGIAKSSDYMYVIISSNPIHLLRIRWYVLMYKPQAWRVVYKPSYEDFGLWNRFKEIPKHVQAFLHICQRCKVWSRHLRLLRYRKSLTEKAGNGILVNVHRH